MGSVGREPPTSSRRGDRKRGGGHALLFMLVTAPVFHAEMSPLKAVAP